MPDKPDQDFKKCIPEEKRIYLQSMCLIESVATGEARILHRIKIVTVEYLFRVGDIFRNDLGQSSNPDAKKSIL
jgi:hypothetical protein